MVTLDSPAVLANPDRQVLQEHQEPQVRKDKWASRVQLAVLETKAQLELLVTLVCQVHKDRQANRVNRVLSVFLVSVEVLDFQGPVDLQEQWVGQVPLALLESRVPKAWLETQAILVSLVHKVRKV